jgi:tetratricopeptide (TPR) repeat protein
MTLRLPFNPQQLLFAATCLILVAGSSVQAQDLLIMQDGKQQPGKILGASAAGVQVQVAAGASMTLRTAGIKEVRLAVLPPEFAQAQKAMEANNYDAALVALKGLEKWKGLPAEWAQQATAMFGDAYLGKGDTAKAEAAYAEFQKLYPSGAQAELGLAKLAIAKKDFATAKRKLEPYLAKANDDKNVSRANGIAYGQAFLIMGQVEENEGNLASALESYLKTVTIFYFDRSAVTSAQQKADALRKAHPDVFVP